MANKLKKHNKLTGGLVRLFLCVCFIGMHYSSYCQNDTTVRGIYLPEFTHDFGSINENSGPAITYFKIYNNGTKPLLIKSVEAECGCTHMDWPESPIQPNDSASIKVGFEPYNRPGLFEKKLTVETNAYPGTFELKIKGFVVKHNISPVERFPERAGNLRFESRHITLGRISNNSPIFHKEIYFYNASDKSVYIKDIHVPYFMEVTKAVPIIQPDSVAFVRIKIDPALIDDFGYIENEIIFNTNDIVTPFKNLKVIATVLPGISTNSLGLSPQLQVIDNKFDFGSIKTDHVYEGKIPITNIGNGELQLHKAEASCNCIAANPDQSILQPGDTSFVHIQFNTHMRQGYQEKPIRLISNDPKQPIAILRIKAYVK